MRETGDASGVYLHRFELFNWGTFHGFVWSLPLHGCNGLLTGDNGSGKSTLMDAVTTLLVPPNRAAYNRAAGADVRERTLRSYVEGYFKSARDEGVSARPVALRGPGSYTVILGVFRAGIPCDGEMSGQATTLAQVFWLDENESSPERLYIVADCELSIREHFSGFGGDVNNLRQRLKKEGIATFESFVKYRTKFSKALGIRSEHALNLFHQTVSMKSIGNLTDFVRSHMLESFDSGEKIRTLINHFDDLTRAHDAIRRARFQIELLSPIVENCGRHKALEDELRDLDACASALDVYFANIRSGLLSKKIARLLADESSMEERLGEYNSRREENERHIEELRRAIFQNGGDRIEEIGREIKRRGEEHERRRRDYDSYSSLLASLGLSRVSSVDAFLRTRGEIDSMSADLSARVEKNRAGWAERSSERSAISLELEGFRKELSSLKSRRTNIELRQYEIRESMTSALGLDPDALPFGGELLRVRPEEAEWEGAAERILHSFGLSLLVPDECYGAVSNWVNANHIGGRLVYFRVRDAASRRSSAPQPDSLVGKLEVKPGSRFEEWLYSELCNRFDYICCDDLERFRRERRAVTKSGQMKMDESRHEKDDRRRIDDRSHYILGWENRTKITLLENKERVLAAGLGRLDEAVSALRSESDSLSKRNKDLGVLASYRDFGAIDWQTPVANIEQLKRERNRIIGSSDSLAELNAELARVREKNEVLESERNKLTRDIGGRKSLREEAERELARTSQMLTDEALREHSPRFARLDEIRGSRPLALEGMGGLASGVRNEIRGMRDSKNAEEGALYRLISKKMFEFKQSYPVETQDLDDTLNSAPEYRNMLHRLVTDDLPRFETRFKEMLNENTIRGIADFQAQLNIEAQNIRDRVGVINRSLAQIDYNPGRYITIETPWETHVDIREFRSDLRACTEDAITGAGDETYSEAKFQRVCGIIERFKGREGRSAEDRRWTEFVTDVRNWFTYPISERWKETDEEYEHYADSAGKSGGQKEKLAYTILAASLFYQFGLGDGARSGRTFRFVMIDEAFGRGSEESARYALELFRNMRLQLLVATPMEKIQVIEPYVSRVGFVHNVDGRNSCVRNMTLEEFTEERERHNAEKLDGAKGYSERRRAALAQGRYPFFDRDGAQTLPNDRSAEGAEVDRA